MQKRIPPLALITLTAAIGAGIALWLDQAKAPEIQQAAEATARAAPAKLPTSLKLPSPPPTPRPALESTLPAVQPAEQPRAAGPAWQRGATPPASIKLGPKITNSEAVQVDEAQMAELQPGDSIQLPLPGGLTVQAQVERVVDNPNGDRTWFGHVDGEPDGHPVVYTQGKNSAFATINTSNGSYSLESINGSGWIYQNPPDPELNHPGSTDFLIPGSQH